MGASTDRLLMAAQLMELKKEYKDGTLRELSLEDIEEFVGGGLFIIAIRPVSFRWWCQLFL